MRLLRTILLIALLLVSMAAANPELSTEQAKLARHEANQKRISSLQKREARNQDKLLSVQEDAMRRVDESISSASFLVLIKSTDSHLNEPVSCQISETHW